MNAEPSLPKETAPRKSVRLIYDASAYYEAKAKLPAPDGEHCVICGKELPKRRRKYCSDQCLSRWYNALNIKDWERVRWQAFVRDNFTCKKCGHQELPTYSQYGDKKYIQHMPELIGDHIKPLFLGGEEFNLENVQTLCLQCSQKKTSEEAFMRRKIEKEIRDRKQTRLTE